MIGPMSTHDEIEQLVQAQVEAWNRADMGGFLHFVDQDVVYVTAGGLLRGREGLEEAYSHDWRAKGGELTIEVELVLDHGDAATAVVHYWLSGADAHQGWSLLAFKKTDEGWRIIADATHRQRH